MKTEFDPEEKVQCLMSICASLCTKEGWDFCGVVLMGSEKKYSHVSEGGKDFIRQHTKRLRTSQDLQRFLGLHVPETENIDEVSTSQMEKSR